MMTEEKRAEVGYYVVGGCGGNIAWHTETDTLEIADKDVLKKDIELYATAVLHFANAERVPIDWRRTTAEYRQTIETYREAAGDRFDLSPTMKALDALNDALERFSSADIPPQVANAVVRDLARILVPINYTRGPRFRHDPALNIPPLPTLATTLELDDHGPDTLGFAETQLMRGQNRLVAALRDARRRVETVL